MDAEQIHRIIDEHTITPQLMPGTNVTPAPAPAEVELAPPKAAEAGA
jgi:hypothetical protein